jgi:hypothetical protein
MTKLNKFMVVHNNPGVDCGVVQENWRKLAAEESATWVRTYFNEGQGKRYCVWLASGEEVLQGIFDKMNVSYEAIVPVEETVPDLWGSRWNEHLKKDAAADNLGN